MSLTLATVADALIEFILSLLRDPDAAQEFEDDPEQALAARGLQHVDPSHVAAVAPTIIERTQVVQVPVHVPVPQPASPERHHSQVVNEIREVTTHFQWVDDRDTIVDQSVNQNIWAEGDVTQTFDNQAVVASGDDAVAAGGDATVDKTWDESTTIEADDDVNIGNDTDVEVIDDSLNEETDASSTTDASTTTVIDDSFDEQSGSLDQPADMDGTPGGGDATAGSPQQEATAVGTEPVEDDGTGQVEADDVAVPTAEPAAEPVDAGFDPVADYVDIDVNVDDGAFLGVDPMSAEEGTDDDTF